MASRYRGPGGRFTTKAKWKRGKKRGDKRYKREPVKKRKKKPPPPPPPPIVSEWLVTFSYEKTGRSLDVIVTARSEEEALRVAKQFLASDKNGRNISRAKYHGWAQRAAKGAATNEEAGEAEYREESEDEESE